MPVFYQVRYLLQKFNTVVSKIVLFGGRITNIDPYGYRIIFTKDFEIYRSSGEKKKRNSGHIISF